MTAEERDVVLPAADVAWLHSQLRAAFNPNATDQARTIAALLAASYVDGRVLGWSTLSRADLEDGARLAATCPPWCNPHYCIVDHPEQDGSRWVFHAATVFDAEQIRVQVVEDVHHLVDGRTEVGQAQVSLFDRSNRLDNVLSAELAGEVGRALVAAGELATSARALRAGAR